MEMIMDYRNEEKRVRAKKRVDELKGFYIHLAVYLVVNMFILVNIYLHSDNFWRWGHFYTLLFWGVGLAFHAAHTFHFNPFFGKKWEQRQIQKYMDEDEKDSQRYL